MAAASKWTSFAIFLTCTLFCKALVCPEKWTFFNGKCWFYSTQSERWPEARDECRLRYGSDLAVINGEREDNFLNYLAFNSDRFIQFDTGTIPHRRECFQKTENYILLGSAVVSPGDTRSLGECADHCLNSNARFAFSCKSAIWFETTKECVLNDGNSKDNPELFVENTDPKRVVEYLENNCIEAIPNEEDSNPVQREEIRVIPGVRNCFEKFKHSSLIGFADTVIENVSERECLSKCWRCEKCLLGKRCKSAVYYREARECILLSKNRRGNLESMNSNEQSADFYERRRECVPENCADSEINLIFVLDGSQSIGAERFNRSVSWISDIVETINDATVFWNAAVIQVGETPAFDYDIPLSSFDTLNAFRQNLSTIGWKRMPKSGLGFAARQIVSQWKEPKETIDQTWIIFLTDGVNNDQITSEYHQMKANKNISIYAIGNSDFVDKSTLHALASSVQHVLTNGTLEEALHMFSKDICSEDALARMRPSSDAVSSLFNDEFVQKSSSTQGGVWLGLRRGNYGTLEWVDGSALSEYYVKPIAKRLEILPENGECILREEEKMWHLENCMERHEFVCSSTPLQNLNDKLRNVVQ
ncbi:hypothetical protein L596_022433 [Steinernema carpocapsae]|uniref:C-type lectin domain-containing protein n=1 Tax=Steinernema carpocapsae TaxID=34508 RepID=A0A4U5MLM9_STECR|nr:hypothetical protein L596_022433 [Steinernema carpocapsae]